MLKRLCPTSLQISNTYFWHMSKKLILSFALLLSGLFSFAQVYKKPNYPQGYFRWPTSLNPDIVANMGELRTNHWHMGLDVRTNQVVNQNVYATADGYIAFVGIEPFSWGRWIIINHPNGLSTLYGHLNDFRSDLEQFVKEEQYNKESWKTRLSIPPGRFPVKKGDFISLSGTTGGSGGPHVHWEVIDTKTDRRLNPTLFGTPIPDNVPPTVVKIAMYDRSNSVYDQSPQLYSLTGSATQRSVAGGLIRTNLQKLSFSIQAYDKRNGTSNQDGIYAARLFLDNREISSFYIDSISYENSRYMNCQVDYKMQSTGGSWMQHVSKLPGDLSGVYYDLGMYSIIHLSDSMVHNVRIVIADADGNTMNVHFDIKNNGMAPPATRAYEWQSTKPNQIQNANFEAFLPSNALYDRVNTNFQSMPSNAVNSVSAQFRLGQTFIPVHSEFEVRIKPNKLISEADRDRIVMINIGKKKSIKKADWDGAWLSATFRDFGVFEAFVDNTPPSINSLGAGEVVNLNKASRISFTPTDNIGIADFRAEVDGRWLRFTNDKGRTWIYQFDEKIAPGQHELKVVVTDIAGNETQRSWQFVRGVNPPAAVKAEATTPVVKTNVLREKPQTQKVVVKAKTPAKQTNKTAKKTVAKKASSKTEPKKKGTKKPISKATTKSGTKTKEVTKKSGTAKKATSTKTSSKSTTTKKKTTTKKN